MKIHIRELYAETYDDLKAVIAWFKNTTKQIKNSDKYYCRYITPSKDKYFIRTGILDASKEFMKQFDQKANKNENVLYFKSWLEHPKTKEFDIELMKFLAHDTMCQIRKHFETHKKYYLKSKMRERNFHGLKRTNTQKLALTQADWGHYLHHIFNMYNYTYDKEVFTYNMLSAWLDYSRHINRTLNS